MNKFATAVSLGVKFLNEKFSTDWYKKIDLEILDLAYGGKCILGQLYNAYDSGFRKLGLSDSESKSMGFTLLSTDYDHGVEMDDDYKILTEAWKDAISILNQEPPSLLKILHNLTENARVEIAQSDGMIHLTVASPKGEKQFKGNTIEFAIKEAYNWQNRMASAMPFLSVPVGSFFTNVDGDNFIKMNEAKALNTNSQTLVAFAKKDDTFPATVKLTNI